MFDKEWIWEWIARMCVNTRTRVCAINNPLLPHIVTGVGSLLSENR